MKRQLNENERLVFAEMARMRNANGSEGPAFRAYTIVDATEAPETAETLKPNERLEEVGLVAQRDEKGNFLPVRPLYRKISASAIDRKTKLTEDEKNMCNAAADVFMDILKKHIKNGGTLQGDDK